MENPTLSEAAQARARRESEIRADIEVRLKPFCAEWPEADFQAFIDEATAIAIKYAGGDSRRNRAPLG